MQSKKTILCLIYCYLPGYKAGGPIQSISNLVDSLSNEFAFKIICSDRDLNDSSPFDGVITNEWVDVNSASVRYVEFNFLSIIKLLSVIKSINFDIVYINSYFSFKSSIVFVLLRFFGFFYNVPFVLAPRGEFSPGALRFKRFKKLLFIFLSRFFNLHANILWHSTSELESQDIRNSLQVPFSQIFLAPNISSSNFIDHNLLINSYPSSSACLRIVFVSRISPKKNLHFLINSLINVDHPIELKIFGPIEDVDYWNYCLSLTSQFGPNISFIYSGAISHADIHSAFSRSDVFVFPTLGENFGHVIFESLSSGTPVIVSDKTPWCSTFDGAIKSLSIDDTRLWTNEILHWCSYSRQKRLDLKISALNFAKNYSQTNSAKHLSRLMFRSLFSPK